MNTIRIVRQGQILAESTAAGEAQLYFHGEYIPGDSFVFSSTSQRVTVGIDHTIRPARLFLPENQFTYPLPLSGDRLLPYPPFAFQGEHHILTLCEDTENEYRNIACNPVDLRAPSGAYPHASANVETRDESVFFARNVIDGFHTAAGHGEWPYQSWGIGARTDAEIHLDFGRKVCVNAIVLYLRADFPHDAHWVSATLHLSDGYQKPFALQGIDGPQRIDLEGWHTITWATLDQLVKSNQPSAFPALRQWEVYGTDANETKC